MKNPNAKYAKQILIFLQQGWKIEFPSGYVIEGDPETGYIDTGFTLGEHYVGDGLRILNAEGVRLALDDEFKYAAKLKNNEPINNRNV